jgi:hypothetical protein
MSRLTSPTRSTKEAWHTLRGCATDEAADVAPM